MICKMKRSAAPLMLSLLLTACASFNPHSAVIQAPVIQPPPAELMEPEALSPSYSEIVRKLLSGWGKKLADWRAKS